MSNVKRVEIGRQLLELTNYRQNESVICKDTVTDAICQILHAAIADGYIAKDQDEVFWMLTACYDHVDCELGGLG